MKTVEIKGLTKLYTKNKGIKNLSFSLEAKECLAIVGKSGSGKSTLLKTMLNLINKDSGSVKYYNSTLDKDYVDIIRTIGYLPDKPYNFPKQKIIDFIKVINNYYDIDYTTDILEYLDLFKLDKDADISSLSSGENQKLSLILTLFHKPKIIILDEPTNFLDTYSIHTLTKILKKLKYEGSTIIIASHSLNFVLELAEKVYLLDNMVFKDIKAELIKNDYKKVTLSLADNITYKDLNIKGVTQISINNNLASFIYIGEISYLLKKLATFEILDISLENPSIEDVLGGLIHDLS